MSVPRLRQPRVKPEEKPTQTTALPPRKPSVEEQQVIVSLKNEKKLVISSDTYHGILVAVDKYKCLFCEVYIKLDAKSKEQHKTTPKHNKALSTFPHLEDFPENLVRQLKDGSYFCTTCNLVVSQHYAARHLNTEAHNEQFDRAVNMALFYKPVIPIIDDSKNWPALAGRKSSTGLMI